MTTIFITGTDTGIGKTTVAVLLLKHFNGIGYQTSAMKPIASGCYLNADNNWVNEDALALQKAASIIRPYEKVNPIALPEPIAPYLAAKNVGKRLSVALLQETISASLAADADINIIEGVGGWAQPLNETELFCDVIKQLQTPVILVVGIKLGCINHALLTYHHIVQMQVPLLGWVANCVDEHMLATTGNIAILQQWINAPCLGIVPFGAQDVAFDFSFNKIFS